MNEELLKIENYLEFLRARRKLLADVANKFLNQLNPDHPRVLEKIPSKSDESSWSDKVLTSVNRWMKRVNYRKFRNGPNHSNLLRANLALILHSPLMIG